MSQNPYQSPDTASYMGNGPGPEVRRVATYQRWVIFALLANIVANILVFSTAELPLPVRLLVMVYALGVTVFAIVAIFLLAREVVGAAVGVLCAILMIVPCVSLIVLLVLNQKATTYLQRKGVRVGFFGVNPKNL